MLGSSRSQEDGGINSFARSTLSSFTTISLSYGTGFPTDFINDVRSNVSEESRTKLPISLYNSDPKERSIDSALCTLPTQKRKQHDGHVLASFLQR